MLRRDTSAPGRFNDDAVTGSESHAVGGTFLRGLAMKVSAVGISLMLPTNLLLMSFHL